MIHGHPLMIHYERYDRQLHIQIQTLVVLYRVYQNDWTGFEVDYIHKYGEQNYKY